MDTYRCGGAILNKFWVISAGHCFCNPDFKCSVGKDGPKIEYDAKEVIKVFFSVIGSLHMETPGSLTPVEVVLHGKYDFKKQGEYDFALIRLSYPLADNEYGIGKLAGGKFDAQKIMPICLPGSEKFKDTNVHATVMGMGLTRAMSSCGTVGTGPEVFKECTKTWVDKHRDKDSSGRFSNTRSIVYRGGVVECIKTSAPPSANNPICKEFFQQASNDSHVKDALGNDTDEVILVEENDFAKPKNVYNLTYCFNTLLPIEGWCATCDSNAKKGTPGYCLSRPEVDHQKNPQEIPTVDPDSGWGICSEDCGRSPYIERLRMTNLYVVADSLCKDLIDASKTRYGKNIYVNTKVEICGAFVSVVKAKTFIFEQKGSSVSFKMAAIRSGEESKFISKRAKDSKFKNNKIVGGMDSCSGDSGGPIWTERKLTNGKTESVLIGVVSRGRGCGMSNSPGIYGRVKTILPWIKKHTSSPQVYTGNRALSGLMVQSANGYTVKEGEKLKVKPNCEAKPPSHKKSKSKKVKKSRRRKRRRKSRRGRKKGKKYKRG